MALANTIRKFRFHHGEMTQKELAKHVGVSRQTINVIEGSKYPPTLAVAFRIADVFATSLENVFFYEPDFEGEDEYADGLIVEVTWNEDDDGSGDSKCAASLQKAKRCSDAAL